MNNTRKGREQVSEAKQLLVDDITRRIDHSPIIGVVNMENLPAKQLASMRGALRGKVELIMTKKRLLKIALDHSSKPGIKDLEAHLKGMPALLLTKENPFSLFGLLKKKRSNAFIKAGQAAPSDIVVKAGPTNFSPGPVIGELGGFKIKAGIEAGKVVIKEERVVAEEGDVVNDKLASLLMRLGIEPMQIGLNLIAVYENGSILTSKILDIDEKEYENNFRTAAQEAMNLAVFAGITNAETIKVLIAKASAEARALAKESSFLTADTVGEQLALAEAQMQALHERIGDLG